MATVPAPPDLPACVLIHPDGSTSYTSIVAFDIDSQKATPVVWPTAGRGDALAIYVATHEVEVNGTHYPNLDRAVEAHTGKVAA